MPGAGDERSVVIVSYFSWEHLFPEPQLTIIGACQTFGLNQECSSSSSPINLINLRRISPAASSLERDRVTLPSYLPSKMLSVQPGLRVEVPTFCLASHPDDGGWND